MQIRRLVISALFPVALSCAALSACNNPSGGGAAATAGWKAGDACDVQWNGEWWAGKILEAQPSGKYKVHYTGWAASWDEVVDSSRLRKPSGTAKKGTGPE